VWVRLDDRFTDNAKIARLSDKAFRVYVHALCYSAGLSPTAWSPGPKAKSWASVKTIGEMTAAGLWTEVKLGYQIHDYLDAVHSSRESRSMRNACKPHPQRNPDGIAIRQSDSNQISNGEKGRGIRSGSGYFRLRERLIRRRNGARGLGSMRSDSPATSPWPIQAGP
jgi:hypothetical protein